MVGKNNHTFKAQRQGDKVYKYAIRRLSVGVASVAVAAGIVFASHETLASAEASAEAADPTVVALGNSKSSMKTMERE